MDILQEIKDYFGEGKDVLFNENTGVYTIIREGKCDWKITEDLVIHMRNNHDTSVRELLDTLFDTSVEELLDTLFDK